MYRGKLTNVSAHLCFEDVAIDAMTISLSANADNFSSHLLKPELSSY
jgi:hypothetical protein